jgi:uncharacterized OB-fold protein
VDADEVLRRLDAGRVDHPECRYCGAWVSFNGDICEECRVTKEEWEDIQADRRDDDEPVD